MKVKQLQHLAKGGCHHFWWKHSLQSPYSAWIQVTTGCEGNGKLAHLGKWLYFHVCYYRSLHFSILVICMRLGKERSISTIFHFLVLALLLGKFVQMFTLRSIMIHK